MVIFPANVSARTNFVFSMFVFGYAAFSIINSALVISYPFTSIALLEPCHTRHWYSVTPAS